MRPLNGVTKNVNKKKLNIYKIYNFTKGGMDIVAQLNDYHNVRSQSNGWNVVAFYYVFDKIEFEFKFVNNSCVLSARNNNGSKS